MGASIRRWCLTALGAVTLVVLLLLYTPFGLAWLGQLAGPLSGGTARVDGLGGFFPNRLHAARVEISDSQGVWLRIEQPSLAWSALALVSNHVSAQDLKAERITVLRRPVPSRKTSGETPRIDIGHLALVRIELAAPVIGHAVTLSAAGALHYISLDQMEADLLVSRDGNNDRYRIQGGIAGGAVHGTASILESADGILGRLAGLPGLGPVNLAARASGDSHANSLFLNLTAGPLKADGRGTLRLAAREADLDFALSAPAMKPRPDISWQSLSGTARFHGRFEAPALQARLLLQGGTVGDLKARQVTLALTGNFGNVQLEGSAQTVTLPGEYPDLFARAPVRFQAQADLRAATRPVRFAVTHPLAELRGTAQTRGNIHAEADLAIPSLVPFAALKQIDMRGTAGLHVTVADDGKRLRLTLNGKLDTQGTAIPAQLLGRKATLDMDATLEGAELTQSRMQLKGAAIASDVSGSLRKGILNYRLALDISDVSKLTSRVQGSLRLRGNVNGPLGKEDLSASGSASLATQGFARQRVNIALQATGLSSVQEAKLNLDGRFDDSPILLHAAWRNRQANLTGRWRSLEAKAGITVGKNDALAGQAHLALRQMADLAVFTGETIEGAAVANLLFKPNGGKTGASLDANVKSLHTGLFAAQSLSLHGTVQDIMGKPGLALALAAQGLAVQGFEGGAEAHLNGPFDRLDMTLVSAMKDTTGVAWKGQAQAWANLAKHQVTLTTLEAEARGIAVKLAAPATVDFAGGLKVDHLILQSQKGRAEIAGQIMPRLALTASASAIALADFRAFLPPVGPQGTLSGHAELSGTIAAPTGIVTIQGRDLRAAFYSRSLPSAALDVRAELGGNRAIVNASFVAGDNARLTFTGAVPLAAGGQMDARAGGHVDLALLDPLLAAEGRRIHGNLVLDAAIAGDPAAPRVTGTGKLTGGELQDYARGARIQDITAAMQADGSRIRLTSFSGRAGPGSLSGSGSIDLAGPGMPIDITLEAKNARPIATDLIAASFSGQLRLTGQAKNQMTLSGKVDVPSGEINLPRNFPPEVASLNVRRRGQPPPPPPAAQSRTVLDVDVRVTGRIFVRGQGVDADMGGAVHVGGTSTSPVITGEFEMNRGNYSLAGQTLDFTTGRVRFDGVGVRGRLDPTLDFLAQTVSGGVTANLGVGGYASAPKITLSSTPQLPQDEVIAHLLFQQSVKQLTPLQLASIAQAVAAIGGLGGGFFNPLGLVRRNLGLDRLSVASANSGPGSQSQTMVEAGRYVTRNVYVGVKQSLSGGTQTQVQVDITRRLKAQATVAAGTTAATVQGNNLQSNESSIGLSYQFEY